MLSKLGNIFNNTVTHLAAYNPNIYDSKTFYISQMIRDIRDSGSNEFWVLNKQYMEIYYFKATQISEFDVQIDLYNALADEHIFTGVFVLHMKDNILKFLEEVPGKIYLKRLDCYRELHTSLYEKASKTKTKKIKQDIIEKIEFIENAFPQLII
jgi:hypothetical protein